MSQEPAHRLNCADLTTSQERCGNLRRKEREMKSLFVGNMNFDTTEGELRAIFEPYGEITRIRMITDRDTGRPRGFGFVELADDGEAARAIKELDGKELDGRALNVNEARPKPSAKSAIAAFVSCQLVQFGNFPG